MYLVPGYLADLIIIYLYIYVYMYINYLQLPLMQAQHTIDTAPCTELASI